MLTCPECCGVTLQMVKQNRWECEYCGTSFDFGRLRNALDMLVGRQFQEDFIDELLSDAKPESKAELHIHQASREGGHAVPQGLGQ